MKLDVNINKYSNTKSLPSWERGLKLSNNKIRLKNGIVAPFMGAWIEIGLNIIHPIHLDIVAPFMGAWIEI